MTNPYQPPEHYDPIKKYVSLATIVSWVAYLLGYILYGFILAGPIRAVTQYYGNHLFCIGLTVGFIAGVTIGAKAMYEVYKNRMKNVS